MKHFKHKWRLMALAYIALLTSINAFGLETYYYQTEVSVKTGNGTVYTSNDYVQPASTSFAATSQTPINQDSVSYVFAKPADGYAFLTWTVDSGSLDPTSYDLSRNPAMIINAGKSTSQTAPAKLSLSATFVQAAVVVESEDNVLGTVEISSPSNSDGDAITLTATPSTNTFKKSSFVGWYKDGAEEPVSTSPIYSLTVDSTNHGVYTAKFKRSAGYFRAQNVSTSRYIYVIGDSISEANQTDDGFAGLKFDGSLLMKDASELDDTDLSYIVKIDGVTDLNTNGLKDADFESQGVSTNEMIAKKYSSRATIEADSVSGGWTFFYNIGAKRYIKDGKNYSGKNYAIGCGGETDHLWTLEPVTTIPVKPSINDGEWISKPLYTSFQYECGDGVSAWYANSDTILVQIEDGKVPANTAVVLRCDTSKNDFYIVPIFDDVNALSDNILQGLCLNKDSINSTGKKFYAGDEEWESSNETYILPSNSVYITVASYRVESGTKLLNNTTAIDEIHNHVNKQNNVYDIAGRKINSSLGKLSKGIYIINGKKVIIK